MFRNRIEILPRLPTDGEKTGEEMKEAPKVDPRSGEKLATTGHKEGGKDGKPWASEV